MYPRPHSIYLSVTIGGQGAGCGFSFQEVWGLEFRVQG